MEEYIACCGINCLECEAYKATQANDDDMREEVAAKWRQAYSPEITAKDINCKGCLSHEDVFSFCKSCKLRLCCKDKGFDNCSQCPTFAECETINQYKQFMPDNITRLASARNKPS